MAVINNDRNRAELAPVSPCAAAESLSDSLRGKKDTRCSHSKLPNGNRCNFDPPGSNDAVRRRETRKMAPSKAATNECCFDTSSELIITSSKLDLFSFYVRVSWRNGPLINSYSTCAQVAQLRFNKETSQTRRQFLLLPSSPPPPPPPPPPFSTSSSSFPFWNALWNQLWWPLSFCPSDSDSEIRRTKRSMINRRESFFLKLDSALTLFWHTANWLSEKKERKKYFSL